jgi:hypothetical protein
LTSLASVRFNSLSYYRCRIKGSRLYNSNNSSINVFMLFIYVISGVTVNVTTTRDTYCLQLTMLMISSNNGNSGVIPLSRWSSFLLEFLNVSLIEECLFPLSWALNCGFAKTSRQLIANTYKALYSVYFNLL